MSNKPTFKTLDYRYHVYEDGNHYKELATTIMTATIPVQTKATLMEHLSGGSPLSTLIYRTRQSVVV